MAYVVVSFIPDRKGTMQTREDSDGIHSFVRICIDPSGPLRFTFRKSKKIYSRCNCEPICTIYYAETCRHSLHEPSSLAVNLVRNIKPRRVFANQRNKQPLVTSAWRHRKHRYKMMTVSTACLFLQSLCTRWITSARARAKTVFGHLKIKCFDQVLAAQATKKSISIILTRRLMPSSIDSETLVNTEKGFLRLQ